MLSKVSFGATALEVDQVASLGPVAFLERQLSIPPADTRDVLTGTHSLDADVFTRWQLYNGQDDRRPVRELRLAAVIRAARHEGQLAERMVEFWSNHLSTYSGEDDKNVRYAAASDDRDVIRAHAMGKFSDLLLASARSVSMQLYLDNYRSTGNRPNQNYAREIMELHTMGAGNGYDEADVEQAARILTAWGLEGRLDTDGLRFAYNPRNHFTDNPMMSMMAGAFSQWPEPLGLAAIGSAELVREFADVAHQAAVALASRLAGCDRVGQRGRGEPDRRRLLWASMGASR